MTFFGVSAGDRRATLASASAAASTSAGDGVGGDRDVAAHLAVDLHRVLDGVVDEQRRVGLGERLVGDRLVVAEAAPQLLADVRGERRHHQHQRLGHLAASRRRPSLVRWLLSSISLAIAVLKRSASISARTASIVRCSRGGSRRRPASSATAPLAGLLVDEVAPQPLQEAVHPDDVAGLPRARRVERAGRHQVQPQRVGPVGSS